MTASTPSGQRGIHRRAPLHRQCRVFPAAALIAIGFAGSVLSEAGVASAQAMEAYPAAAFHQSIGVNAHLGYSDSRFPLVRDAFRELGVLHTRGKVQPGNVWRARALWDCCGVRTVARIDSRTGDPARSKLDPRGIANEVTLALTIGSPAIAAFEGPNEYNHYLSGNWAADLVGYQRLIYAEVRRRGLGQPVVGPSIYERDLTDIRKVGNIGGSVDAANLHFYIAGNQPAHDLDVHVRNAQLMAPGEPLWVTEFGYHNATAARGSNAISEVTSARYVPRLMALLFSQSPRGRHYLYELIDGGTSRTYSEHNFGLIRYNGSRKPAFFTLQRLIGLVRGGSGQATDAAVGLAGDLSTVRSLLLQKAPGHYLLLLWQEVKSWDQRASRVISWADKAVTVSLPRAARIAVHDTLPFPEDAQREVAPRLLANVDKVSVDVPDHLIAVEFRLN